MKLRGLRSQADRSCRWLVSGYCRQPDSFCTVLRDSVIRNLGPGVYGSADDNMRMCGA